MQISEVAAPAAGQEPCRFPKLEECAHFHYERVQLGCVAVELQAEQAQPLHSAPPRLGDQWFTLQVASGQECWLIQRTWENFTMLDEQLHQCIYDRKVSQLPELTLDMAQQEDLEAFITSYLSRLCHIIDNSLNCGPILNWFQLDNRGRRLLVPSEESRSINTPAVAAAYSVRKYVSQARDELSLEVGDMISVIDMAAPGESVWWRGKRGFQVGFFPQHCVHIIGDKVPRNMPLPPPVVGSLAISPIKPVLRKHGKLITFFRSFILNRPSRRRLKQSGILKERVFGCDLGEHLLNSGHDIPMVLKCCAEFIETNGIVDGIYRLSGVTSNIQKLRNAFDEDRIPNLYTDDILQDIHSVASLLKMYFRELPNPLCTYQLYQSFVAAVQGCNAARSKGGDNDRLLKMREAVQKLPPPHYRTLEYLMRHLAKVATHGPRTGMTTRNVAIVWAPNLLRCEELEVGGVAALQGVGVQAVVTEFLICYADLIFSDRLPNLADTCMGDAGALVSPKRSRPKSLAISTPTKLLTLEEARNKHLLNKSDEGTYIEVGGGPKNLPKKYHTIIELPAGSRKRSLTKRSPSGWRSFFSKSRNNSHGNLSKHIEISPPGELISCDKSVTESDLTDIKRKLRPVKSAESLTSGQSEPTPCENDVLGPLYCLNKPQGHNRSVSHDSYFDNLQSSNNNSVGSLLDLSEIQLNFELEESEMRIFSEDESLVSSPKVQRETATRKMLSRARPEEFSSATNSSNPSPKKQARVVISPDSLSRKRSRIEDQLSDIQYIDCNTPDNSCLISTTAVVHNLQEDNLISTVDQYQPKNKSPRNSHALNRHSLNFENTDKIIIPKSLTEMDIEKIKVPPSVSSGFNLTPTPGTPNYKPLDNTSSDSTPILSPDLSPDVEIRYENLNHNSFHFEEQNRPKSCYSLPEKHYENVTSKSASPTYENIRTTISITYRSPTKSMSAGNTDSLYEDVVLNPEKAVVPTTVAELPKQEAQQPEVKINENNERPKDLNLKSRSTEEMLKSDDDQSNGCKSTTYKSIESLNSTPLSLIDPENSKKSLITPTEISMSDVHSESNSPRTSTSLSPLSPKQQQKISNLLISGTEISMTDMLSELNSSQSSTPLSPLSPQKEQKISCTSSQNQQNTSNLLFSTTEISNDMRTELNSSQTSSPLSPLSPQKHKKSGQKNQQNTSNFLVSGSEINSSQTSSPLSPLSPHKPKTSSPKNHQNTSHILFGAELNNSQSSESLSPLSPQKQLKTLSSTQSLSAISSADAQTQNSTDSSEISPLRASDSLEKHLESPGDHSSLSFNKLNYNDKRKSCDDEILDQNSIYQQVKYFRRSIHEINSLLDLDSNENKREGEIERLIPEKIEHDIKSDTQMDSIENFDSLEAENNHIYENVANSPKNHKDLDECRNRMHESEPKKLEISPEKLQGIPVCSKCLPEIDLTQNSVKNLTNKFEAKEEKENEQIKDKKPKNYDKDGLPPCLRAKNAKNSVKTKADENAFVTEFGRPNNQLQRRKSLDDRTSSYINSKLLIEPQTPSKSTLDVSELEKIKVECPVEQKLNRERIEKYKEERRIFLREKYRSESFREDKDKILSRLKQKSFRKTDDSEKKLVESDTNSLEYKESRLIENDAKLGNNYKKLSVEALSKFENKESAVTKSSAKKHHSPLLERRNRTSLKEISDKILDDANGACAVSKEDDFIRVRRGDSDSEKKRHTYDLMREREIDTNSSRRVSLESRNPRKEKVSPSYCIKDMKAIFESKSTQH